jgi:Rrf2 family transcriptional regulator, cysteine metabolism repressor
MQISTKGRYGLRAVLELARHEPDKPVSTKEISNAQKVTVPYLEQLFFKLKNKGLVKSVRGAQGGYYLARKPEDISVGEIIECLDGAIEITDCEHSDDPNSSCIGPENCRAVGFWNSMKKMINDKIYNTSLADIINSDGSEKAMGMSYGEENISRS